MNDPVRDRLATQLSATHTIERELGGGGMARVFVATERALGRQVVIKTLPDDAWTASAAQRFHREILTAAQLQHANIVPVLSAGDAEGVPYFTMPLVEGATLRERLLRGLIPLGEAIGILRDVARALAAAHAKGVVHRDIKPENILLSSGAALVTDFGVAKAVSLATQGAGSSANMTALGVAVGTPAYMAPEQIAADPSLDHRADLYAWGVVAYEVLSGARPFAELNGTALIQAQMGTVPPALRLKAPNVPVALTELVMRCLAKEAHARPQSAGELLAVLDLPSGERAAEPASRGRRIGLAAAVAVAVLAVGAWWMLGRSAAGTDEKLIAVAPFRVGGASPEAHYLREGLGDIIVPQIQTVPDRGAANMRSMLDRWRSKAGSAENDLDDAGARAVAASVGAGQLVLGEIVGTRDRLTVNARLLRTRDGKQLATAQVNGSADSVLTLATKLVTALLSLSDGATQERMRSVLSARADAISPYLRGEQLFRRGRYSEAGRSFAEAYAQDSTFAIAALRVSLSNGWSVVGSVPGPWIARAWANRAHLSGADSLLLIASTGSNYPAPVGGRSRFAELQALAQRGNTAELWYSYADALFHAGPQLDEPDALGHALEGFQRAEALDSSFTPALEHQSALFLIRGDTTGAKRALDRQAARDSTGDFFRVSSFALRVVLGDAETSMRELDRLERTAPEQLWFAANSAGIDFLASSPKWDVADSALARARRRGGDAETLANIAETAREMGWNSGRPQLSMSMPAASDDAEGMYHEVMAALLADGDTLRAARSAAGLAAYARTHGPNDLSTGSVVARFGVALWALAHGDTATAEHAQRDLRAMTPPGDLPWTANTARVLEQLLGAQFAVARRAPDARARLEVLDSLLIEMPGLSRRTVRTSGNFILAGLWENVGEPERAQRAASRRDYQFGFGLYQADRLRRQARLARTLGQRDREIEALRMFIAMRERAEPQLQPEVEKARARLAELTSR